MKARPDRRTFVKHILASAAAIPLAGAARAARNSAADTINIACVGVGGKGWSDMLETSVGHNIVAVCDIDEQRLAQAAEKFPQAKTYTDWRKLLEQKDIDAVTISTPDHTHAPVTMSAIMLGKHVYTQKPLTHDVFEARRLAQAAKRYSVVTQMGIQHHSSARLKSAVQVIRDGVIGRVSSVHTWTDRPGSFWKQGLDRPEPGGEAPPHVHWDAWLGTAPARPYHAGLYHPFAWRGWWDFGTGALGDMGCHILDPVVHALELGPPATIRAEGPLPHADSGPTWCIVHFEFPGTRHTHDRLRLTWYESDKRPPRDLFLAPGDWKGSENGVLFIGDRGNLFVGFPEPAELFPKGDFNEYRMPEFADDNHYTQWTGAILGREPASCPFDYSGPLTETVLLGNVAFRSGATVQWNSADLSATGAPDLDQWLRRDYRDGWTVRGLS